MMNDIPEHRKGWLLLLVIVLFVMLALMLLPPPPVYAATITVTTTVDEQNNNGQCSLREAITNANANNQSGSTDCAAGTGDDTISFGISGTIALSSELTVNDAAHLTIDGSIGGITLSGNNATRVFLVNGGADLTLKNLTIANGSAENGGGITNGGTLTISSCNFTGNMSSGSFAASGGGAIFNTGTLAVLDSIFDGNAAVVGGGAALAR
jgi:CSLREA domain-containing protein